MAKIKAVTLADKDGNAKFPRTYTKLVTNSDGDDLDTLLEGVVNGFTEAITEINNVISETDNNLSIAIQSETDRATEQENAIRDEVSELYDELNDSKADTDEYYPQMSVGVADNLTGRGEAIEREFVFEQSGGVNNSIPDEDTARINSIQGNTLVYNQLNKRTKSLTLNGVTATVVNDTTFILNGTPTSTSAVYFSEILYTRVAGHIYFLLAIQGAEDTRDWYITDQGQGFSYGGQPVIFSAMSTLETVLTINTTVEGVTFNNKKIEILLTDLTKMFGAGNEPATAEEAEKIISQLNVPEGYNAGQLISNNTTAIKTVGFNAFDGAKAKVIGGATYELLGTFDSIGFTTEIGGELTAITIPANLQYTPTEDGYIYAEGSDICIHLTNTGYRNGDYEPYIDSTRQLPTVEGGLKSVGLVYDEIKFNKSTLKWEYVKRVDERTYTEGDESDTSVVTDGTTTYYALDEAVTTELDSDNNPDYKVWDWGTEQAIQIAPSAPFKGKIVYGFNAVDQIRGNKLNIDDLLTRVTALEAQLVSLTTNTNNDETITE